MEESWSGYQASPDNGKGRYIICVFCGRSQIVMMMTRHTRFGLSLKKKLITVFSLCRLIYSNKTVWTQALNRVISTPGPLRNSLSFIESWASTSDFFCYDRDVEYLFRPPLQMSPCGIVLSQVTNPLLSLDGKIERGKIRLSIYSRNVFKMN